MEDLESGKQLESISQHVGKLHGLTGKSLNFLSFQQGLTRVSSEANFLYDLGIRGDRSA